MTERLPPIVAPPPPWWRRLIQETRHNVPGGFFRNVAWQYGGTLGSSAIGFFYTLIVARALGVEDYGLMALGLNVAAIVSRFATLYIRDMVIKYLAEFHEGGDLPRMLATIKLSLLLDAACGALSVALIMAAGFWAGPHVLHDGRAWPVLALSAVAYVSQNVADDTALGVLRLFNRFRLMAVVDLSGAALRLALAAVAIWGLEWGVFGVLGALALTNLLVNLTLLASALALVHRIIPLRTPAPISLLAPRAGEIRSFLTHNYFMSVTGATCANADLTLVGYFVGKDAAGVYRVAKSFVILMSQAAYAVSHVLYPHVARLWSRGDFARLKAFVRRLSGVMGGGSLLLYGALFVVVPPAIRWMLGPQFAEAGTLFRLMAWGVVVWTPFMWATSLLLAAGRTDLLLRSSVLTSVVVILLLLGFTALWGARGAAVVDAMTVPLSVGYALVQVRRAGLLSLKGPAESPERTRA